MAIALIGVVSSMLPVVLDLEKDLGLAWLFDFRGPRKPPAEVVVISIDNPSLRELGLPEKLSLWPRSLHTQLIRILNRYGAKTIVFDVFFRSAREEKTDREFASELSKAGNVILFAHLDQRPVIIPNHGIGSQTILMDRLVAPLSLVADSALSYAPFPLPKVPARLNQAWLFKSSSGDIATLPVVALHHYIAPAFKRFRRTLDDSVTLTTTKESASQEIIKPGAFSRTVRQVRQKILLQPDALPNFDSEASTVASRRLHSILRSLHQGPDSYYIDFYGPPQTITSLPYYKVIQSVESKQNAGSPLDFSGKAVFIGNSEPYQPDLKDDFYTVFSGKSGFDLSGVEIIATVFANLIEGRSIQPISQVYGMGVVAFWGLVIGGLFYLAPVLPAVIFALSLPVLYLLIATVWFTENGVWVPLVTPLLLQLPVAVFAALSLRYFVSQKAGQRFQQSTRFFLPGEVVDLLPEWNQNDIVNAGRTVEGVCLASDAESYTSFAENIEPRELKNLLNRYFDLLFQPVRGQGGSVLDVVGDSMLAFWENKSNPVNAKLSACRAAIEIQARIAVVEPHDQAYSILPTRIGLHAGEMLIGNVGAGDHYAFRAVGDMINSTSRIEGLNKFLGTRVLASAQVVNHLDGIVTRRTGKFRLKGKDNYLEIFEVVCCEENVDQQFFDFREQFLKGLIKFEQGRWRQARSEFETGVKQFGQDGPSLFYLQLCERYLKHGSPESWDGINRLLAK